MNRKSALFTFFAIVGLVAAGCSGGGEETVDDGGGGSLSISGTPPAQVLAGSQYSFTPSVDNPNGGTLTFTATNLPNWASLNSGTGQINGSPGNGDVGTYSGLSLTVSNGTESITTPSYTVEVVGTATGAATLSWTPPTQRTDGSPLGSALAGYRVYWGTSENNLNNSATINNPGITTYIVDQLTPGTWHFAATALDNAGLESAFSNLAQKTISP